MIEMLQVFAAMLAFAVPHSILVRLPVKSWVKDRVGERAYEGFYRITYNALSVLTFVPVFLLLVADPGEVIWRATGLTAILLRLVQVAGLIGLTVSILQIDGWRFMGVSQLRAYLAGDPLPLPPEPLQTGGVYRYSRHPLYLFSLMLIWPASVMTEAGLAFSITATLYFVFGSLLEERTMLKLFGEQYRQYRENVPWLFPIVKLSRQSSETY